MKIKRTKKHLGSGSGKCLLDSDLFYVTEWHLTKGIQTVISTKVGKCYKYRADLEIRFDGKQDFTSDKLCVEQLTPTEVLSIINQQKGEAFESGFGSKAQELRTCLGI